MQINIKNELNEMGIYNFEYDVIQEKDSIQVSRISCGNNTYVLKLFQTDKYVKEIYFYDFFRLIDIPTLQVISHTQHSILFEDIENSEYRLCTEDDYNNPQYVKAIAQWFKNLHICSKNEKILSFKFYEPTSIFSKDDLLFIKKALSINTPAMDYYINNYERIIHVINTFPVTVLHNDCGYNNSAIKKDNSSAFMFDYNYASFGYAYSDIHEMLLHFNEEMKELFLFEYGCVDLFEKKVHQSINILNRIIYEYQSDGNTADVKWCIEQFNKDEYYYDLINTFV